MIFLRDVDDAVDVEGDFFGGEVGTFVGETVCVFSVFVGVEGVVAHGSVGDVDVEGAVGFLNLLKGFEY